MVYELKPILPDVRSIVICFNCFEFFNLSQWLLVSILLSISYAPTYAFQTFPLRVLFVQQRCTLIRIGVIRTRSTYNTMRGIAVSANAKLLNDSCTPDPVYASNSDRPSTTTVSQTYNDCVTTVYFVFDRRI